MADSCASLSFNLFFSLDSFSIALSIPEVILSTSHEARCSSSWYRVFLATLMSFSFNMNASASSLDPDRLSRSFSDTFRRCTFSTRCSVTASRDFDAYRGLIDQAINRW